MIEREKIELKNFLKEKEDIILKLESNIDQLNLVI